MRTYADLHGIDATLKAFKLYLEHCRDRRVEPELTLTRCWMLIRFYEARMLRAVPCTRCGGRFLANALDLHQRFVCCLCCPPSRAGKTKEVLAARAAEQCAASSPLSP